MFKKNEFRAILARKEISASEIAKELGIDPATLSRKISGQSDFYRNEIEKICRILELSPDETMQIFCPITYFYVIINAARRRKEIG